MMMSDGQMITCIDSIEQRMRTAATAGALTKALCGVHVRCMGSSANRARTAERETQKDRERDRERERERERSEREREKSRVRERERESMCV